MCTHVLYTSIDLCMLISCRVELSFLVVSLDLVNVAGEITVLEIGLLYVRVLDV